jgi:hypothetical protein
MAAAPALAVQVSALHAINDRLPRIYRTLTGAAADGAGDATCSFLEAGVLAEGVSLVVRPPGQRWRAFASLSGGQQALAALALSFALQVFVNQLLRGGSCCGVAKRACCTVFDSLLNLNPLNTQPRLRRAQEVFPSPFYFFDEIDACERSTEAV